MGEMGVASSQRLDFSPTILLLNLPPSILCGIDLLSFTTSAKFQGIKDLPPGWHFIFTSETSSLSIRDGFWFYISVQSSPTSSLAVREWDAVKGCLTSPNLREMSDFDRKREEYWEKGLSPYRQSADREAPAGGEVWQDLTRHITADLLQHLTQNGAFQISSASCARQDQDHIPGVSIEEAGFEERELGTLGIDLKKTWRDGAVGRERTEGATDRSWALNEVVLRWQDDHSVWGRVVLGQMEACFIMVLTVANYSCLEEWKRCLGLILTCKSAVTEHPLFFASFLELLKKQMMRCEDVDGGLFDMGDGGGSLLKTWLKGFKRTLEQVFSEGDGAGIKNQMEELERTLKDMYGWELNDDFVRKGMLSLEDGEEVEMDVNGMDEEDESGEYAPVIVDMPGP